MKKVLLVVMLLSVYTSLSAICLKFEGSEGRNKPADLFSIGTPIDSIGQFNFINLFRNFPLYIDNADKIDLMYYHYIGKIESDRRIRYYVKRNFPPYVPSWGIAGSSGSNSKTGEFSNLRLTLENDPFGQPDENLVNNIIKNYVHVGDGVWEVVFKLWGKVYHYYMFVDSNTHEVVRYGNLFGVNIPQSHIDYIDKARMR